MTLDELLDEGKRAGIKEPIRVWPFTDAPQVLRDLANSPDDNDWLVLVPKCVSDPSDESNFNYIGWLESPAFSDDVQLHCWREYSVYIGSHA